MPSSLTNGVEITRVNNSSQGGNYGVNPNLAVGSQRPHALKPSDMNTSGTSAEYGGKLASD